MEKAIRFIIKVGSLKYMELFFNKGEMYFDTVESFSKKDKNQERYDPLESAIDIEQVDWLKLQAENGQIFEFSKNLPKTTKLNSAYKLSYDHTLKGNIYSCTAVTVDNIDSFKNLDPRFQLFGNTVVLIQNPNIFLNRVEEELKRRKFEYEMELVNYYDPNKVNGKLSVFCKKEIHSYQNEIRIWINNNNKSAIKIHIGSIKDIASTHRIDPLLKRRKYEA